MVLGRGLESLIPPQEDNPISDQYPKQDVSADVSNYPYEEEPTVEVFEIQNPEPTVVEEAQMDFEDSNVSQPEESMIDPVLTKKDDAEEADNIIFQIELDKIKPNPHQPRKIFNEESLRELAQSIREFGILQPLVVSKVEEETDWGWSVSYQLIAGHRRLLASKMIGLQTVPVIIRRITMEREKLELAVIENIQRDNLNPVELARAVARLQDEFNFTQREIASRLGKSREVIANSVRLLGLPTAIQNAIEDGRVNESQARLLLSIDDEEARNRLFRDIIDNKLSVREVQAKIRKHKRGGVSGSSAQIDPDTEALQEQLEEFLGTKVSLVSKGTSGKITITYYSPEELGSIVEKLLRAHRGESAI